MQVRRILDNIRGRPYEEALGILEYAPYRACEPLLKLLISVRLQSSSFFMHCKHIQATLVVSDNSLQYDQPKYVQALCF